jgi:hypothetical protein
MGLPAVHWVMGGDFAGVRPCVRCSASVGLLLCNRNNGKRHASSSTNSVGRCKLSCRHSR